MWVVSLKRLREFWRVYPNAAVPLRGWHTQTAAADWRNLNELREVFPAADLVGNCTIFNIGGNNFRLVTRIFYRSHKVYVLRVMTHRDYDREDWPAACGCYTGPPGRSRRSGTRSRRLRRARKPRETS